MNASFENARLRVCLAAACGIALGVWSAPRSVSALTCVDPEWTVELESVTSEPAGPDHTAFWPDQATLVAWDGTAIVWATSHDPGTVHRIEGRQ